MLDSRDLPPKATQSLGLEHYQPTIFATFEILPNPHQELPKRYLSVCVIRSQSAASTPNKRLERVHSPCRH